MNENEVKLKKRITQLEAEFKRNNWLIPDKPDPDLAAGEWWAIFSMEDDTVGSLSKIAPKMISGNTRIIKVKAIS